MRKPQSSDRTEYMRMYMRERIKQARELAHELVPQVCARCGSTNKELVFSRKDGFDTTPVKNVWVKGRGKWREEIAKLEMVCHECQHDKMDRAGRIPKN